MASGSGKVLLIPKTLDTWSLSTILFVCWFIYLFCLGIIRSNYIMPFLSAYINCYRKNQLLEWGSEDFGGGLVSCKTIKMLRKLKLTIFEILKLNKVTEHTKKNHICKKNYWTLVRQWGLWHVDMCLFPSLLLPKLSGLTAWWKTRNLIANKQDWSCLVLH